VPIIHSYIDREYKYKEISLDRQIVYVEEPILPTEVVLQRDAQLDLRVVVQEFHDQVFAVKIETGP
jgi:hypothetical protein